ncbi:helix-turn-helix domain-containing protein [Halobacteriales archaeon QS_6_71_20]|nr:MAG: helix-turn-helix domain-containing protein [Halobacteriales archaeon QS_6_71_20]
MYEAQLHLRQQKSCVLSTLAERADEPLKVDFEELHDHKVTFVLHAEGRLEEYEQVLDGSEQVEQHVRLDDSAIAVTKESCGGYDAVYGNHGILRRRSRIAAGERVYTVLFFEREDLKSIVEDFREIGTVTLRKLTRIGRSEPQLTDRQREVIEAALRGGYFEWPRRMDSDELAEQLDISRATCLEHLRKAEERLLRDALEVNETAEGRRPSLAWS